MLAIVCDKCGNTALVENGDSKVKTYQANGYRRVSVDFDPFETELDLCPECAKDLLGLVRGKNDDGK